MRSILTEDQQLKKVKNLCFMALFVTFTFADDDIALEVNPVALRKLEHGVKLGLGCSLQTVVLEFRQDVWIWTTGKLEKEYYEP